MINVVIHEVIQLKQYVKYRSNAVELILLKAGAEMCL